MKTKVLLLITITLFLFQQALGNIYYVNATGGNDATGNGSSAKPWRTLRFAASKVPANRGHTIQLSAGTFVESGLIELPPGVSITGAGKSSTILKAASSFYYNPASPGYATNKFLISLRASNQINGNQQLRDFTIDGDLKKLHGGIYVRYRNNVVIENVKVQNTNFTGIWLWDVKDSRISKTDLINCSWGSTGYCAGALNLGNIDRVEIDQLNVDEGVGYGIKAIGPNGYNDITALKIHDSRISVHPYGLWNNGSAANIAIELWQVNLVGCEIYNTYVDNTISLVNSNANPSTGIQTIRVHHNTFDIQTRANGEGYGLELTVHDAEVDHNYFLKGRYGIANWDNPMKNWEIHHNVFYALEGVYPGDIVRSQWSGLHNVNFYNNTIEFAGTKTMNIIGVYGGTSDNVKVINNLFINNNSAYSYYPNSLIHMENGAVLRNFAVKNNFFDRLAVGSVAGAIYASNLTGDPRISKTGNRPHPYYAPIAGSPLIEAGLKLILSLLAAPDIGAYETVESGLNQPPQVSLTQPINNSTVASGSSLQLAANASDADGTISRVEFYRGTTKIGEDVNYPYTFDWSNPPSGNYSLTAKATDNQGATATSGAVAVTVTESIIKLGLFAPDAMLGGSMRLTSDATASKGSYFSVPPGHGTNHLIPPPSYAQFSFNLPETDSYVIWVRMKSPSTNNQGYHVYDGKGHWTSWLAGVHGRWTWVKITNAYTKEMAIFPFTAGANSFRLCWFHENVPVDRVLITNDHNYVPTDITESIDDGHSAARSAASSTEALEETSDKMKVDEAIALYPNPVKDVLTISLVSEMKQEASISIKSATSFQTTEMKVSLLPGRNEIPVDMHDREIGMYVISIIPSAGQRVVRKVMVTD